VLNKSALVFDAVSNMSRYLGRNALTDTGYVKKYMNPTKLYKGRYEFHYQDEFTGTITGKGVPSPRGGHHHLRTNKDLALRKLS
jgi:hypothetical protein